MPSDGPGPWVSETTLYWNTVGQRNHMHERQPGGAGGVSAFKQAIVQFALVTTRTVRLPFFLGAREKGYHGNTSNP